MKYKKILITGSEGFIGSHLVESLVRKGFKVRAFVLYNSFQSLGWLNQIEKQKNLEIFFGDIRSYDSVNQALKDCDAVIHMAALIGIPYSYKTPKSYLDTNIIGTYNVLEASNRNQIKKVIITSTSEVYGTANYVPIDEKHTLNPQSPYAASKISADHLSMSYYYSFNLPVTILRPFNTFGPRQSPRAVIPALIKQFLKSDVVKLKVGNLSPTRNFNFVEDTINSFEKALNTKRCIGKIINIGSNYEVSVKDLIKLLEKISKKKVSKIIFDQKRVRKNTSEVFRLSASNKLAKKILSWKPRYHNKKGFEKALSITYEWFEKNMDKEYFKNFDYDF